MTRIVITGAAGFLGSHLTDALLSAGHGVIGVDNFATGRHDNLERAREHEGFCFLQQDVSAGLVVEGPVTAVYHLASPASPPDYLRMPLETLRVGSRGTENALELAHAHRARFVLASTSEVYGDPLVHPQDEQYWGRVNPVGPRSVYDEAKRYAEALTTAYARTRGVNAGIVRIFNTYGPRLRPDDGRVVSNFIVQALAGRPLTIYGDGAQTRSFCFVDDLVDGLVAMLTSSAPGPINLGNPAEVDVAALGERIRVLTGSSSPIERRPLPLDDPTRRQPDISLAEELLGWRPTVDLEEGLRRTIDWFAEELPATRRAS